MDLPAKEGWVLKNEKAPSLCKHFMPLFGIHEFTLNCWCGPQVLNEHKEACTIVIHE